MLYLVKRYKIFGKFEVEVWVDDFEEKGEKVIRGTKRVRVIPLPKKTVEKLLRDIERGKIKPIKSFITDADI